MLQFIPITFYMNSWLYNCKGIRLYVIQHNLKGFFPIPASRFMSVIHMDSNGLTFVTCLKGLL